MVSATFDVETAVLVNSLKCLKLNRYCDIAIEKDALRISSIDDQQLRGYAYTEIPITPLTERQGVIAGNAEYGLFLKTVERFFAQQVPHIRLVALVSENILTVKSGDTSNLKEYCIPCTFGGLSKQMVYLNPAAHEEILAECEVPLATLQQLIKNLQAVDSRAQLSLDKTTSGDQLKIESLSCNTTYREVVSSINTPLRISMGESYFSRSILIPKEINSLLKLWREGSVILKFYSEYLYIETPGIPKRIILPVVSSYFG